MDEPAAIFLALEGGTAEGHETTTGTGGATSGERPAFSRYELTDLGRGPWRPDAAHGGAPAALLAREVERHADDGAMRIVSMAYTFLGPVFLGKVDVESAVIKPGRLQKVVDARIVAGDRTLISVRAVLLRKTDIPLPEGVGVAVPELPDPESCERITEGLWADGGQLTFHSTSNEVRRVEGGPEVISPTGKAWFRLVRPVVVGEEPSPAQRAAAAGDFGNGLAHPVHFGNYTFVNCDLSLTMHRDPVGEWIGLSSLTEVDSIGSGSTTTDLHDSLGRFGVATQALFVDLPG